MQCAVNICHKDEASNIMRVESFTNLWVENTNATCFYHGDNALNVIAAKVWSSTGKAAKAAAVPCLMALTCFGVVIFRVYRWRKSHGRNQEYQGISLLPYMCLYSVFTGI